MITIDVLTDPKDQQSGYLLSSEYAEYVYGKYISKHEETIKKKEDVCISFPKGIKDMSNRFSDSFLYRIAQLGGLDYLRNHVKTNNDKIDQTIQDNVEMMY